MPQSYDTYKFGNNLNDIARDLYTTIESILNQSPYDNLKEDVRYFVFAKLNRIIKTANISYFIVAAELKDPKSKFWKRNNTIPYEERIEILTKVTDMHKHDVFIQSVSATKLFLRAIFRFLYENNLIILTQKEYETQYRSIASISPHVLKFFNLKSQYTELFEISFCMRNDIHTGVYAPFRKVKGEIRKIRYRGVEYTFEVGEWGTNLKYDTFFNIINDLIQMINDIISSDKIFQFPFISYR